MRTRTREQETAPFNDLAALIAAEKAEALASFDPQAFRAAVLSRLEERRRRGWAGSPRLAAACTFALLLVVWAVLAPGGRAVRPPLDVRVVEKALRHGTALRTAGPLPPAEPAHSNDVWAIERALLTWRRQQGGSVDVERALCSAAAWGRPGSCPPQQAREVVAPDARRRLERALIDIEKRETIHRALMGRRRT